MDRKQVLLDDGQMARQREFTEKIHAMHQARGRTPLALVDTFGCQQNVADSQHILGMLRDMGCEFTDDAARADEIFTVLMGEQVEPRKDWIERNAKYAVNLDF